MDKPILIILTSGVVSAGIASLLIFLFKSWISERIKGSIQHEYDQKLEAYKSQLKAISDISIEQLKSQLQITAAERSIKLTKVFEQQADTITETYAKLVRLKAAIADYTVMIETEATPPKSERRKIVSDRLKDLWDYYEPRKIYLPKDTQSQIDGFVKQLHEKTMMFMYDVEQGLQQRPIKPEENTWFQTLDFLSKDAVEIMESLDTDLKKILGLLDEDKKTR